MSQVNIILALLALSSISYAEGMTCSSVLGISYNCPAIFSSREQSYCCPQGDNSQGCCTEEEFLLTYGSKAVLPIVLGVLALVLIFICCVCCACCSCCPCYRKRERGAVYVRGPSTVVQVNNTPAPAPASYGQNLYPPAQPVGTAGMPQAPPAYTNEVYSKQSPYNPNYPN